MNMNLKDDRWCFACGTQNPHGLRLDDIHLEDDECVCTFTPDRWHQGWAEIIHGGITSTLLDEVMTHVLWRRGYDAITAEMTVRLKQQIPVGERLTVRARIARRRRNFAETEAELLLSSGEIAATATAKFLIAQRGPDQPGGRISLAARHAVIFDMFGTLAPSFQRNEYFAMLATLARTIGMEQEAFIEAFRADAPKRTTGQWQRIEDNIADIARRAGLQPSEQQIAEATRIRIEYTRREMMNPYPDAIEILRALREAGRPVGLISDCSPEAPLIWPDSPLAQFIEQPVLSAAVGLRKPDPRIYQMACERMGVDPYETVYVGDGDSNELPGAEAVGLCPILIDRGETSAFRTHECRDCEVIVHDLTQVLPLVGLEPPRE